MAAPWDSPEPLPAPAAAVSLEVGVEVAEVVGTVVDGTADEVELENGNVPECYGYLKLAISQNRFHVIRRDVLRRW